MWNEPTKKQLEKIPKLYETENILLKDKIIHMHFFIGGCDWYIIEYNGDDLFFGYALLNGDTDCAEWGYISFRELKSINISGFEVDRDLHWEPKTAQDIPEIKKL